MNNDVSVKKRLHKGRQEQAKRIGRKIAVIVTVAVLTLFVLLEIFPFYLSLVQSLQPKDFKVSTGLEFWPQSFSIVNYWAALRDSHLESGYLWSIIYAGFTTIATAFICLIVAYVLEKKRFRGRNFVFMFFMTALMVPGEILLITNYLLITELGLLKTPFAVVMPGLVNVFGIFLMKQFMHTVPDSVLESAKLDGANEMRLILGIVLPLVMPAIATYSIMTFTAQWNEYLWPQLVLSDADKFYNVQLRLLLYRPIIDGNISHPYATALRMSATMLTLIPVLIVYFIFQKQFTEGISVSGLK